MVIVGVMVRMEPETGASVARCLDDIEGVSSFELVTPPHTLGALIEAPDLEAAHRLLCERVRAVPGVQAAWPVHTELEQGPTTAAPPPPPPGAGHNAV